MKIDVLTLFPQMFSALNASITGKAQKSGAVSLACHNLRNYAQDKHRTVDDSPFGGESGMVLKPEPLKAALDSICEGKKPHIVFLTPQGTLFTQEKAKEFAKKEHLLLITGHYKGIDERIREKYVDEEISIGDYVLTGGELPAMVLIDSVSRLLPGIIGESMETDSHFSENLLGWPVYTRPEKFDGLEVPKVLLTGHHKNMEKWRKIEGLKRTKQNRPDLFKKLELPEQKLIRDS